MSFCICSLSFATITEQTCLCVSAEHCCCSCHVCQIIRGGGGTLRFLEYLLVSKAFLLYYLICLPCWPSQMASSPQLEVIKHQMHLQGHCRDWVTCWMVTVPSGQVAERWGCPFLLSRPIGLPLIEAYVFWQLVFSCQYWLKTREEGGNLIVF